MTIIFYKFAAKFQNKIIPIDVLTGTFRQQNQSDII